MSEARKRQRPASSRPVSAASRPPPSKAPTQHPTSSDGSTTEAITQSQQQNTQSPAVVAMLEQPLTLSDVVIASPQQAPSSVTSMPQQATTPSSVTSAPQHLSKPSTTASQQPPSTPRAPSTRPATQQPQPSTPRRPPLATARRSVYASRRTTPISAASSVSSRSDARSSDMRSSDTRASDTRSSDTRSTDSRSDAGTSNVVADLRRALEDERRKNRELTRRQKTRADSEDSPAASRLRRQVEQLKEAKRGLEESVRRLSESDREKQLRLVKQRDETDHKMARLTRATKRDAAILMEELKTKSQQVEQLEKQLSTVVSKASRLQRERDAAQKKHQQESTTPLPPPQPHGVDSGQGGGQLLSAACRDLISPDSGLSSIPEDSDEDRDSVRSTQSTNNSTTSSSSGNRSPRFSSASGNLCRSGRSRSMHEIRINRPQTSDKMAAPRGAGSRDRAKPPARGHSNRPGERSRPFPKKASEQKLPPGRGQPQTNEHQSSEAPHLHALCVDRVRRLSEQVEMLEGSRALYRHHLEEAWEAGELLEFRLLEMQAQHEAALKHIQKLELSVADVKDEDGATGGGRENYSLLFQEVMSLRTKVQYLEEFIVEHGLHHELMDLETSGFPAIRAVWPPSGGDLNHEDSPQLMMSTLEDCKVALRHAASHCSMEDVSAEP